MKYWEGGVLVCLSGYEILRGSFWCAYLAMKYWEGVILVWLSGYEILGGGHSGVAIWL